MKKGLEKLNDLTTTEYFRQTNHKEKQSNDQMLQLRYRKFHYEKKFESNNFNYFNIQYKIRR